MEKRCTKCGETKDISEFGVDNKAKDGHFYWCRECAKANSRKYYYANSNPKNRISEKPCTKCGEKCCTKCGETKDIGEFGVDNKAKDGLFGWCKECARADKRRYYRENREKMSARALARHHEKQKNDESYREKRKARQRVYNQDYMKRPEIREKAKVWSKNYTSNPKNKISRRVGYQIWVTLRNKLDGSNGKKWQALGGTRWLDN